MGRPFIAVVATERTSRRSGYAWGAGESCAPMSCFSGCPQKIRDLALGGGASSRVAIQSPVHAVDAAAAGRSIRVNGTSARRFSSAQCSLGDSIGATRAGGRVIGLPKKQHLAEQDFVITRRLGVVPHSTSVNGHGHINGSGGSPNGHAPPKVNGHTKNNGHMNGNHMNGTLLLPAETSIEKFDEEEEIVLPCDGLGMNRWIPQKTDRTVLDPAVFGIEMYVRDYELDQYNVVNHSIFVNYLDHARHEFLSRVGCHPDKVADDGKALAIIRQDMRYWAPLRARSKFRSTVRVVKITKARCIWEEEIWKVNDGSKPDELIASAETEGICLNEDYRPIRIPKHILVNFEEFRRGPDICLSH